MQGTLHLSELRTPWRRVMHLFFCSLLLCVLVRSLVRMRKGRSGVYVPLIFLISATRLGEAFLIAGSRPRFSSAWQRPQQHDLPAPSETEATAININTGLPAIASRTAITSLSAVPADASTEQQLPSFPGLGSAEPELQEGEGAAQPPPAAKDSTRRGTSLDGTPLAFRPPTTEDLHKLDMGNWVARKGLAVALVALDGTGQETKAAGEAVVGAPLAGAVVEAMEGVGGSSVATRVCLLRHRREGGVSEGVEHALLDEAINQFLNDGARISQVCTRRLCCGWIGREGIMSLIMSWIMHVGNALDVLGVQLPCRFDNNNNNNTHRLRRLPPQ